MPLQNIGLNRFSFEFRHDLVDQSRSDVDVVKARVAQGSPCDIRFGLLDANYIPEWARIVLATTNISSNIAGDGAVACASQLCQHELVRAVEYQLLNQDPLGFVRS